MAIPRVPLNIDDLGYAGPMVPPLNLPSTFQGGGGGMNMGLPSAMMSLLKRRADLQGAMARAELERMRGEIARQREETAQFGKQSRLQDWMMKEEAKRAFAPRSMERDRTDYGSAAQSLLSGERSWRSPGDTQNLASWLRFIGPEAAHKGLMQSGALLGSQSAAPLSQGEAAYLLNQPQPGQQLPGPGRGVSLGPSRADLRGAKARFGRSIPKGTVLGSHARGTLPSAASPLQWAQGLQSGAMSRMFDPDAGVKGGALRGMTSAGSLGHMFAGGSAEGAMGLGGAMPGGAPPRPGPGPRRGPDFYGMRTPGIGSGALPPPNLQAQVPMGAQGVGTPMRPQLQPFARDTRMMGEHTAFDQAKAWKWAQSHPEESGLAGLRSSQGASQGYRAPGAGAMTGSRMSGFKKGTLPGTIPETGTYELHKGEIVVSEPQVDEPLLGYLVEDKLRKGITKTTPKGSRSYQGGTLRPPPADASPQAWAAYFEAKRAEPWRSSLPVLATPRDPGFTMPGRRMTPTPGGWEMGLPLDAPMLSSGRVPLQLGPGEAGGGLTVTGPGIRRGGGTTGPSPKIRQGVGTSPRLTSGQKLLGPGSTVDEIVEVVAKETGQTKGALKKLPKGVLIGMAAGLGVYVAGKALMGSAKADVIPGSPGLEGPPEPEAPLSLSERMIRMSGVEGAIPNASDMGSAWSTPSAEQMLFGAGAGPDQLPGALARAGALATPEAMGRDLPLPELGPDPEALYARDLEVASSRARGGDFGSQENPLTLRGEGREPLVRGDERLPPEMRAFAPEEAGWREGQSQKLNAQVSRMQADRIRSTLMNPNSNIDPDTRKELLNEAKFLDTVAQSVEDRFQAQKDKWLEAIGRANDVAAEVEKERIKAEAKGFEMGETTRRQQTNKLDDRFDELTKMLLDPKNFDMEDDSREAIVNALVGNAIEKAYLDGEELSPEIARQMVLAQLGMPSEE